MRSSAAPPRMPDRSRVPGCNRTRRTRPTAETSLRSRATILFERSLQAQILKPLVISTAFGLMASILLVLLALPCMYMIIGDLGWIENPDGPFGEYSSADDHRERTA